MVVLFRSENDYYFQNIIEYLRFYKCEYIQVDLEKIKNINCTIFFSDETFSLKLEVEKNRLIDFIDISCFFYRSGKILKENIKISKSLGIHESLEKTYFELETTTLINFIYSEMKRKSLGWLNENPLNKLLQLKEAKRIGLHIPTTYITTSKREIKRLTKSKELVTKAVQENIAFQDAKSIIYQRVAKVSLDGFPDEFYPSLFQEIIEKDLEIRCFYLDKKLYSIAFFSLEDTIDMRDHYDNQEYFKLKLSSEIETKIKQLMKTFELKIGSIDLILSKDGKCYFIEINTEGQYDWVSAFGGYNLDKKIANYLLRNEKRNKNKSTKR